MYTTGQASSSERHAREALISISGSKKKRLDFAKKRDGWGEKNWILDFAKKRDGRDDCAGAKKSMVLKWNGKARLFAVYNRILLWEVPCTDRHFLLFFLWGCKGFVHFLCRPSILSLPRASLICNCEPYPHLKLWCAQTWWNWCGSKKVLKCRNKSFATEVLFKCCRIYSLSSRMRDVKAVYPTPPKAYFRVSDNQSSCIFTCKAHQESTLPARKSAVCVVLSFTIVTLCW